MLRYAHGDSEPTVPETAVVGAQVADVGQVMHEGNEYGFVKSIRVGNCLAIPPMFQILKPFGQKAEGHDLAGGPNGGEFRISVAGTVMINEGLSAAIDFFPQAIQALLVFFRRMEVCRIQIEMTSVSQRQDMRKACSEGNFNSFNGFKHKKTELAVEQV